MSRILKPAIALAVLAIGAVGAYVFLAPGGGERAGNSPEQVTSGPLTRNFRSNVYKKITSWEISPSGQESYVALPLPDGGLEGGASVEYTLADGASICTYDMRITKEDGTEWEHKGRNLCGHQTYYTYDDEFPITFVNESGADLRLVSVQFQFKGTEDFNHLWAMTLHDDKLAADASITQGVTGLGRICPSDRINFRIRMGVYGDQKELFMDGVNFCDLKESGGPVGISQTH